MNYQFQQMFDTINSQNSNGEVNDAKYDSKGRRYTNDNLISGIIRFSNFGTILSNIDGGLQLDPSLFKRNVSGYDIRAACTWIHNNSGSSTLHACAKYIRSAIDVGFGTNPNGNSYTASHGYHVINGVKYNGRPDWAWKYIYYLPTIGFAHIGRISRQQMNQFIPEPGDIAVYQQNQNPNVPGHICMWTGVGWTSDFKQRTMFVYGNTPFADVFRFS